MAFEPIEPASARWSTKPCIALRAGISGYTPSTMVSAASKTVSVRSSSVEPASMTTDS